MKAKLVGTETKYLELELSPNEDFFAEKGSMVNCDNNIKFEVLRQNNIIKSKLSGESMFICRWFNPSNNFGKLCIVGQYKSLLPIKIQSYDDLIVRCGEYVASTKRVDIISSSSMKKTICGVGLIFQKIIGEGTIFVDDSGNTQVKQLAEGEEILVDEQHVLGFLNIDNSKIKSIRKSKNFLAGEGFSIMSVTGPGTIFISSTPLSSSEQRSPVGCLIALFFLMAYFAIVFIISYYRS